jgi:predicted small secreted protein
MEVKMKRFYVFLMFLVVIAGFSLASCGPSISGPGNTTYCPFCKSAGNMTYIEESSVKFPKYVHVKCHSCFKEWLEYQK